MIQLPVSEAYAYDHLAILYVKNDNGISDDGYKYIVKDALIAQMGLEKYVEVITAPEFFKLIGANQEVWRMVDKATRDECLASEVDAANQRRYAAKKALQERFWPASPLSEVKSKRPNDLQPEQQKPTVATKSQGGAA